MLLPLWVRLFSTLMNPVMNDQVAIGGAGSKS